jgi:hypothetical protein
MNLRDVPMLNLVWMVLLVVLVHVVKQELIPKLKDSAFGLLPVSA